MQRWIVARMRNETHFSLASLNERIAELLEDLNDRVMRRYGESRRQLFERLDRPTLKPLPATRFVFGTWKDAGINIDYHVAVEHHYYSAPFQLANERGVRVDVRYTASTVEIFLKGKGGVARAQLHARRLHPPPRHMPKGIAITRSGRRRAMIRWRAPSGEGGELVTAILAERPQGAGYRPGLGILRPNGRYGERLEAACAGAVLRALLVLSISLRSMLEKGTDRLPLPAVIVAPPPAPSSLDHENVQGPRLLRNKGDPC